jgi:hypothetical protein
MVRYNEKRKMREAQSRRAIAELASRTTSWSVAIAFVGAMAVAAAVSPIDARIWIVALSAIGGIALFAAVAGVLLRGLAQSHDVLWRAALFAISAVMALAVAIQALGLSI